MNKLVLKQINSVQLGDLVRVEWFDASVGKSLTGGGTIDVPVKSWGVYLGVLGERNKHIILAQNNFRYADQLYDIDFTAIPDVDVNHNNDQANRSRLGRSQNPAQLLPSRTPKNSEKEGVQP